MQKQINIEADSAFEKIHELVVVELGLEEVIHWDLGTGPGNLNGSLASFKEEDAHFVAGYGQVDLVPVTRVIAIPGDQHTFVGESACRVLVGSELGLTT